MNPSIIVMVEVFLEEGESAERVRDAFRIMDKETRKESGCLKYVSSVDVNDHTIIHIYELWESLEVLELHFKTPHMTAFQEALSGLKTKSMNAKVYEISKELPFPH